jgi:uridylate kinase
MKRLKKSSALKYKRVLLKLSGEVLAGSGTSGIDFKHLNNLAKEVKAAKQMGVQIAMVIGGGNFWRFRDFQHSNIERTNSDYMGMMATVMNSIAFASALQGLGVGAEVFSALPVSTVVNTYEIRKARASLQQGNVVICAGGTGNPFFTTDTAASLRAAELNCDLLMKATNVDFVYDSDPKKNKKAKAFTKLSYMEVLERQLRVMDLSSVALCSDSKLPISVFNLNKSGNIAKVIKGKTVGTIIS